MQDAERQGRVDPQQPHRFTAALTDFRLGLVDLVARVGGGRQARRDADRAVHVDHAAAAAANQVVMVVADPVLVARRRPGGLNAADQTPVGQDGEGIVHGLARDGADLGPCLVGHLVSGAVRSSGDRPQSGQALRGDLDAVLA